MDDKPDVAGLVERLRAYSFLSGVTIMKPSICTEAATALKAQAAEIARLKEELAWALGEIDWMIPLSGVNPNAMAALRERHSASRAALTGSQSHDAVAERLKAGTDAAASQVLTAEVDLLMHGDPAAKPKPWGSQSHD